MSWHALIEPWTDPLLRRAVLEAALLAVTGGALGCWVLAYELAYGAESLAHALFPGLVAAALLGLPLLVGGAAGIVVAALAVALAARVPVVARDTAVAVVVTALFGLGALLALSPASPAGVQELLFGDVLGVGDGDLAAAGALAVLVIGALALLHGRLLAVGFDRAGARALGAVPWRVDAALLVLLAVTILVAVQGLGNLLVVAVLVAPAAVARRLAGRMAGRMAVAAGAGVVAAVGGLYLSYYAGTAAGASIAAVAVGLWVVVEAAARGRTLALPWAK